MDDTVFLTWFEWISPFLILTLLLNGFLMGCRFCSHDWINSASSGCIYFELGDKIMQHYSFFFAYGGWDSGVKSVDVWVYYISMLGWLLIEHILLLDLFYVGFVHTFCRISVWRRQRHVKLLCKESFGCGTGLALCLYIVCYSRSFLDFKYTVVFSSCHFSFPYQYLCLNPLSRHITR